MITFGQGKIISSNFRWIIDSRAVVIEGKRYIVPGADFINHVETANESGLPVSEIQVKLLLTLG